MTSKDEVKQGEGRRKRFSKADIPRTMISRLAQTGKGKEDNRKSEQVSALNLKMTNGYCHRPWGQVGRMMQCVLGGGSGRRMEWRGGSRWHGAGRGGAGCGR